MRIASAGTIALAVSCALSLAEPAWAAKATRTPLTSRSKNLEVSPLELRIRVRALIRPTLGILEQAADQALRQSPDRGVRRSILTWKIETTTTLLAALLRQDPSLAFLDSWGYVIQVKAFVGREDVQAQYGPFGGVASQALTEIEDELRSFADGLHQAFSTANVEVRVKEWADGHPIEGTLSRRASMDSVVAAALATASSGGALGALGGIEETTGEVVARMDLYTMYMPRLMRWEAELAMDDLAAGIDPAGLVAELERFTRAADRIAAVAEGAPGLVGRERATALAAVGSERKAVLEAIHQERIATLAEVEAIAQRLVDRSSGPLHAAARKDMEELVQGVEMMRRRLIDDTATALNSVVDHAFVKGVQLLLIAAGLGALGLVLYARVLRR